MDTFSYQINENLKNAEKMLEQAFERKSEGREILSCLNVSSIEWHAELKKDSAKKRQAKKYIQNAFVLALIDSCFFPDQQKRYWDTWHCGNEIDVTIDNGSVKLQHAQDLMVTKSGAWLVRSYCGRRWCLICNGIRTAKLIHKYKPELEIWPERYFLTLTIENCHGIALRAEIEDMGVVFRKTINDSLRKKYKLKFRALRKLEVTYSRKLETYHPHYHIIVDNEEAARAMRLEWLRRQNAGCGVSDDIQRRINEKILTWRQGIEIEISSEKEKLEHIEKSLVLSDKQKDEAKTAAGQRLKELFAELKRYHSTGVDYLEKARRKLKADPQFQDLRESRSENDIIEILKYTTKLVTRQHEKAEFIPASALVRIFEALHGKRTLQPYGFKLSIPDPEEELETAGTSHFYQFEYSYEIADWIHEGQRLCNAAPERGAIAAADQYLRPVLYGEK